MKTVLKGKTKATQQTIQIILTAMRNGATQRDAAVLSGISEDTLSLWKREDSDFSEQIRQKEIQFKMDHVEIVREASKKTWQAAAWLLERKYPHEYGNRQRVEVVPERETGYEHLTDEQLTQEMEKLDRELYSTSRVLKNNYSLRK